MNRHLIDKNDSDSLLPVSFCLPKKSKLLNKKEFSWVFDSASYKASHRHFLILARDSQIDQPRFGLVIAKKHIKLAVQRNRIKRIVRENFRLNRHQLPQIDAIVLSRNGLANLDNPTIHKILDQLWQKIQRKA